MVIRPLNFSELPGDLNVTDETLGPPPAWFRPEEKTKYWGLPYYFPFLSGLGDKEAEVEVNPVEALENLKFKQEMPKKIPSAAFRYTNIDPLSPMFRSDRARYGYGEFTFDKKAGILTGIAVLALIVVLVRTYLK